MLAIFWGFLGWLLRVFYTYYVHSKKVESKPGGRFVTKSFIKKYDQDWIMSFVAMLVFALISDWAWNAFISELILNRSTEYNPKANVLIGFLSIYIIEKLIPKDE